MPKSAWGRLKSALGWGPPADQRLALTKADRWGRLLKALRVEPKALMPALSRELARGLDDAESRIRPAPEAAFFDALLVGRKIAALDMLCAQLDPGAARERVRSKVPSLREWARGALSGALSYAENPEGVEWARSRGMLETGKLREGLMAEAIESGSSELARRELGDAGREKLSAQEAGAFMEGLASRKAAGLSSGLDADGLDALAASFGGWGELAEACAGLGPEEIMDFARLLLEAIEEEELVEAKIMQEAKAHASKRARELMAMALAAQAAASDRPKALRALVLALADRGGARAAVDSARARVGGFEVSLGKGSATLHEIASLSGAEKSKQALAALDPTLGSIERGRLASLAGRAQAALPRGDGFGAALRGSTPAWREAARQWRREIMGGVELRAMSILAGSLAIRARAGGLEPVEPSGLARSKGSARLGGSAAQEPGAPAKPL